MGREQAQAVASMLIHANPARCLAMSGICAGRRGKVALGDVIFADRLWSYDAGKLFEEDGEKRFQGDMLQFRPSPAWVQRMQAVPAPSSAAWLAMRPLLSLEQQEDWILLRVLAGEDPRDSADFETACPDWSVALPRLWARKWLDKLLVLTDSGRNRAVELSLLHRQGLPTPSGFRIHVAPMATGAAVNEDTGVFPRLASSMRKVLGVEMEASALGALGEMHDVPVVVAKGVSDYGDPFKDDRYRDFAARAAAECLIALLRGAADLLQNRIMGTTQDSAPKTNLPLDLIRTLAEAYPDVGDARALWERAGGKASDVENISRPQDLWQRLWLRSVQGAAVRPVALLQTVLQDQPNNAVVIRYLNTLRERPEASK
jgi:nucleoside phosphorylase